jgi:hypothetical protein
MKHQTITTKTNTVNDCTESKCINCINNNGCIYKRSAYEIPEEEIMTEQSIATKALAFVNEIANMGNTFQYGLSK